MIAYGDCEEAIILDLDYDIGIMLVSPYYEPGTLVQLNNLIQDDLRRWIYEWSNELFGGI